MDLGIHGRGAFVAAASKGLGRGAAEALAAEGVRLAITARGAEALERTAAEIRERHRVDVHPIVADMARADDVEDAWEQATEALGDVDILVTNAGGPPPGYFADFTDDDWRAAAELNLMSAIRLVRLALPAMQARGWGRIVNVTSISVKQPIDHLILSNTVRAGVVAFAKTLARQVAADGVTINNVAPGIHRTDRIEQLARAGTGEGGDIEEALAAMAADIPAGRMGTPGEFGALVAFLASEPAAFITGATIQADGGAYAGLL